MKAWTRKILAGVFALVMALTLVSCGGEEAPSTQSPGTTAAANPGQSSGTIKIAMSTAQTGALAEAGVSHLITQLFFDNVSYYRFLNMARKAGISLPVQAGIMPIVSKRQIERTVALSSASLPPQFTKMISRYDHDEQALFDAGIEYAVTQIRDLITGGADGIHLYAMNNARVARLVYEGIRDLLPERT